MDQKDRDQEQTFVDNLLFVTPGGRRFTVDSPILPNVWRQFAIDPWQPQKLILTLDQLSSAGRAAFEIRQMITRLRDRRGGGDTPLGLAYIPGQIAITVNFEELMRVILPLTPWWQENTEFLRELDRKYPPDADLKKFPLPDPDLRRFFTMGLTMMFRETAAETGGDGDGDVYWSARKKILRRIPIELFWFVKLAGTIALTRRSTSEADRAAWCADRRKAEDPSRLLFEGNDTVACYAQHLESLHDPDKPKPKRPINEILEEIADAFFELYTDWKVNDTDQPKQAYIWRADLNRPVHLSVSKSRLTVKADAGRRLFDISCAPITWAIIDSGIDGAHPAFRDLSEVGLRKALRAAGREDDTPIDQDVLGHCDSRVIKTLDFTRLREMIDYDAIMDDDTAKIQEKFADQVAKNVINTPAVRGILDRDIDEATEQERMDAAREVAEDAIGRLCERIKRGQDVDWEDLEPFIVNDAPDRPQSDHGTHVAGILGADWVSDDRDQEALPVHARKRTLQGVCPDIKMIDVRVFRGDRETDEFELVAAVQFLRWMNARAGHMVVHGANVSLSLIHAVNRFACGQTPICAECNEAVSLGMVIVAAAGNKGFDTQNIHAVSHSDGYRDISITDPGNAEKVITVGATHRKRPHEYGVSYFSSRGPTGDGRSKPDLVAPGEKIKGPTPDEGLEFKDGTSMAAPHVSGAAAMLMARHTELIGRPVRIKQILCETATDLGRQRDFQGAGLLDVLRALQSV